MGRCQLRQRAGINFTRVEAAFPIAPSVGKHTKQTDKQTGTETQKWTFTDVIKKGKLTRDLLNKGSLEQLKRSIW